MQKMAISFDSFISKWTNRGIDFDGAYGDQCMDLMHQYIVEVLGLADPRILAAAYARYVFERFDSMVGRDKFTAIKNTPTGIPQKGDIVLWGAPYGSFIDTNGRVQYAGHVAIFVEGNVNRFKSFDQNWPAGSKCHLQEHSYDGVIGWLRFKGTPVTPTPTPPNPTPNPTPAPTKTVPYDEVIYGTYEALTGFAPSEDELKFRRNEGLYPKDMIISVTKDHRFIMKYIDPIVNPLKTRIIEQDEYIKQLESQPLPPPQNSPVLSSVRSIVFGKWTWVGKNGWKNRWNELKQLLS